MKLLNLADMTLWWTGRLQRSRNDLPGTAWRPFVLLFKHPQQDDDPQLTGHVWNMGVPCCTPAVYFFPICRVWYTWIRDQTDSGDQQATVVLAFMESSRCFAEAAPQSWLPWNYWYAPSCEWKGGVETKLPPKAFGQRGCQGIVFCNSQFIHFHIVYYKIKNHWS